MAKKTVIDKATVDKPCHVPIDPNQRAILVIRHEPTGLVISTRGWTLNEVLATLDWNIDDVWATFKRTWTKDYGAVLMSPSNKVRIVLDKLNSGKEEE